MVGCCNVHKGKYTVCGLDDIVDGWSMLAQLVVCMRKVHGRSYIPCACMLDWSWIDDVSCIVQ